MLLDLSEIVMRQGMRVRQAVDQPAVEDPDLEFAEPIRGQLSFENSGDLLNIHGLVESVLRIPCNRCLAEVQVGLRLTVDEHLPIDSILHPDRPPEEGEEPETIVGTVVHLEQGRPILDLDELLRQLIISEIPIRIVCDEACLGLCPHCGANRNETPCACGEADTNTPLAGLRSLLREDGPTRE